MSELWDEWSVEPFDLAADLCVTGGRRQHFNSLALSHGCEEPQDEMKSIAGS